MYSTAAASLSTLCAPFLPATSSLSSCSEAPRLEYPPPNFGACKGALFQSGLRTPPDDENMDAAAYHQVPPRWAALENAHAQQPGCGLPPASIPDRTRAVLNERPPPNEQIFNPTRRCTGPSYSQHQAATTAASLPQPRVPAPPSALSTGSSGYQYQQQQQQHVQIKSEPGSQQPARPSTPPSDGTGAMANKDAAARDAAMVNHSLRIPQCISPRGGNLADFVADVTTLIWFESPKALETAEKIREIPANQPIPRVSQRARAPQYFKKWVQTVLATTQVTQNVVLLALLYIYRLKKINPRVDGRSGSEYRLFTVALMLGNKFLDDNTYTNKTWADVTNLSVGDIHVMEVEFLSNLFYTLLASKEEWDEWLVRLAKIYEFLERANKRAASPSPLRIPSPTHRSFHSPLPSPTGAMQLTPVPFNSYSPNGTASSPAWPPYPQHNAVSPLALKPEPGLGLHRKRSFPDVDPSEPPAKRMSRILPPQQGAPTFMSQPAATRPPAPAQVPSQGQLVTQRSMGLPPAHTQAPPASDHARLSVPNLTLNTNHGCPAQQFPGMSYAPPQASPLSLPPLVPGVRAMSTVFPPAPSTYAPPHPILPSTNGTLPSSQPMSVTPTTSFPPVSYGTPTKRLSPQSTLTPTYGSSPMMDSFHSNGTASGMHTPVSLSPSIYLQQRNSPYKPVRHVNKLLHPPPSSLQHYHLANTLPPTQMHYQPLGRRNDLRTGIVPEFALERAGYQGGYPSHGYNTQGLSNNGLPNPSQWGPYPHQQQQKQQQQQQQPVGRLYS